MSEHEVSCVVRRLITYPVKGCAGIELTHATLAATGVDHDRVFMVVDDDGGFRSQRRDPLLAIIRPAIDAAGSRLTLRAPGVADLHLDVDLSSARRPVRLFGTPYFGIDQGKDAATWLSALLGAPRRLVRVPPEHDRVTDGWTPGTSGYADSSPVHAVSRASLDELNRRLDVPLPMERFRPNIVLDGWDEPHLEDRIRRLVIGTAELGYAKPAIRCAVTMVDQDTGGKAGPEPLRTLATYRRAAGAGAGVAFGVKFSVVRPGELTVGDSVSVTSWHLAETADNSREPARM
ncbi:MOSC domain-containing protein [Nonomuraea turkmeniaca]|uniref:MOSC domain-containing protein n=1 Tax=Nonomuraea turkmeniaca TaxID=103838 RepID=A0A5S4F050_9ACTN|nr:MOSC N-terminal beta barrel domain-containing protein [Nonomuraea turkmeniaca]TMR09279.1 MOSC domain-containing protein [Nonomuraea turkmeniaca]